MQQIDSFSNRRRSFPPLLKLAGCAYLVFHLIVALNFYGPLNYLWFCDLALITTVIALCTENRLLLSMTVVSVMGPALVWSIDFIYFICSGHYLIGMAEYMSDARVPIVVRVASTFHLWLPALLIWMMFRLGYDRRAIWYQTLFAIVIVVICRTLTAPPPARSVRDEVNINGVYGNSDVAPQTRYPTWLYLCRMVTKFWLVLYLPTHAGALFLFDPRKKRCPNVPADDVYSDKSPALIDDFT